MELSQGGGNKLDRYEILVIAAIALVLVGGFFSYRYLRIEESSSSASKATPTPEAAADTAVAEQVSDGLVENPAEEIPETNPFAGTNPFEEAYENPFE